ncbi:MAG: FeoB small GTPase domain-containing protein [Candidatus Hadarchaeota archaeon]
MKTIALAGNPNVGKSVLFNRLTGVDVSISNYPGTTVDYTEGLARIEGEEYRVVDLPGSFSLEAKDKAEEVAGKMLEEMDPDVVVCVIDATSIERGLYLCSELIERGFTMMVVLNMSDEARDKNIEIDVEELEKILGIPVISTVATAGIGMEKLASRIEEAEQAEIGKIREKVLSYG